MAGPTDAQHFALLVWRTEVRFTQGRQGGFNAHGLLMEHHHCTSQSLAPVLGGHVMGLAASLLRTMLEALPLSLATPCFAPATATPQALPPHATGQADILHQPTGSCGWAAGYLRFASKQGQECQEQPWLFAGDLLGGAGHMGSTAPRPPRLEYSPRAVMDTGVPACRSPTICHSPSSVRVHSATRHS